MSGAITLKHFTVFVENIVLIAREVFDVTEPFNVDFFQVNEQTKISYTYDLPFIGVSNLILGESTFKLT